MNYTGNSLANIQYSSMQKAWKKMRDVIQGEEQIKNRSLSQNRQYLDGRKKLVAIETFDQYIRPTDSMRRLRDVGLQRFCDYIFRAKFYPFPLEIQQQSLGLIENQPASIELPPKMEGMLIDATTGNEDMEKVLSVVNTEQLQVSRVGMLLEPSSEPNKPFNIAMYLAESMIDWHEFIDEFSETRIDWLKIKTDEVDEDNKPIYLILLLDENGTYAQYKTTNEAVKYGDSYAESDGDIPDTYIVPAAEESPLDEIPFVITNVTRLGTAIERPFLESVADASLSLYRASAHYEDALYWGGESTMFSKGYGVGTDEEIYIGNGANNKSNQEYADAKYVTMGTDGIGPRKDNVQGQFEFCVALGVDLINKGTESGTALNIRSNVKTASLKTLSSTGALGLQTLLRIGANWLGLDPETVNITANTTFADANYTAEDFSKFSAMVSVGAMRSLDLYQLQKKHDITTAESFEEWNADLFEYTDTDTDESEPPPE